jgi:hypothetical protein
MTLLLVGSVDAKTPKRKTRRTKAKTTATTKPQKQLRTVESLGEPRIIDDDMLHRPSWGYEQTKNYYEKALQGDGHAQYCMGLQWSLGGFTGEEDKAEALRWYYLGALNGYDDAQNRVGEAYDSPYLYDYVVDENRSEAAYWFSLAAEQGHDHARFMLSLYSESEKRVKGDSRYYGTWKRAGGDIFTIVSGPYFIFGRDDGDFRSRIKANWTSDGRLHVGLGFGDLNLKYSNGYLYDDIGRRYWKIP